MQVSGSSKASRVLVMNAYKALKMHANGYTL